MTDNPILGEVVQPSDAVGTLLHYYEKYANLIVEKYRTQSKDLSTSADVIKVRVIAFGDFMAWLQAQYNDERNTL